MRGQNAEPKYLESYFDTQTNIRSRRGKSMTAFTQYRNILSSMKLNMNTRVQKINAYVINKKIDHATEVFPTNIYRKIL